MKILFGLLFGLSCFTINAQTYTRYSLTNFVLDNGQYTASTNIAVGANVIVYVESSYSTPNISANIGTGVAMSVKYPEGAQWTYPEGIELITQFYPVLGPCTINIKATSSNNSSPAAHVILRFATVNTAPSTVGLVQAPNHAVTVSLQSSTNLTTWSQATNGVYGATDYYRFFRVSLE